MGVVQGCDVGVWCVWQGVWCRYGSGCGVGVVQGCDVGVWFRGVVWVAGCVV